MNIVASLTAVTFRGSLVAALGVLAVALIVASSASADKFVAHSHTTDGNRTLDQAFEVFRSGPIDYIVLAEDPDGVYPFCATVQLEKRTKHEWTAMPKSSETFRHQCFKTPADTGSKTEAFAGWSSFLYPKNRISRKFRKGELRVHGFTDLGGKLIYRR